MLTCYKTRDEHGRTEFWVFPDNIPAEEMPIRKDGNREVICDDGRTWLVEGRFEAKDFQELGRITSHGASIRTCSFPGGKEDIVRLKQELGTGLNRIPTDELDSLMVDIGCKGPTADEVLLDSYIRHFAMEEKLRSHRDGKLYNTAVTIRATKEIAEAGLEEHLIFGVQDPPKIRKADGKRWLESDTLEIEVLKEEKLFGMKEIQAYIERHGKDSCSMIATDPSFDEEVFAYDDRDDTVAKLASRMANRYLDDDLILHEPWGEQHAVDAKSIFIVRLSRKDGERKAGEGPVIFSGTADEKWEKAALDLLPETCISGYDHGMDLIIYSANRSSGKRVTDTIRRQLVFHLEGDDKALPFCVTDASGLDKDDLQELRMEVAMDSLTQVQWKAVKSWLKASEASRKHAVLRADFSRGLFKDVLDDASFTPGMGTTAADAAKVLAYMMLTRAQACMDGGCQLFFIPRTSPSGKWMELSDGDDGRKTANAADNGLQDVFRMLADHELHILVLPGTQADSFSPERFEEKGFTVLHGEDEATWLDMFRQMHDDIIQSTFPSRQAEGLKEGEGDAAAGGRNRRPATIDAKDVLWNDAPIAAEGADILGIQLGISAHKTEDTVLSIPPESPLMDGLAPYGDPGPDGWHIAAGSGTPLSEDHARMFRKLLEDHVSRLLELMRLSSSGQPDVSIGWNGEEHRPGRAEDPIRFVATPGAVDVVEEWMKAGKGIASLMSDGRLRCGFIQRPDLGIRVDMLTALHDELFDGMEYLAETPDILMMRAVGQNPSRSAFKKMMADLERLELRADAVEMLDAVLASQGLEVPPLPPVDHPIEVTAPKGTVYALVEDIVLLPNGKKPPKAYVSIWSADMSGKFKAVLDSIPDGLSRRLSALLMMMGSDSKVLEVIESTPKEARKKGASGGNGTQGGIRSVKTVSLTREFRHRVMQEKTDRIPVPRSTDGKILADISVRKHMRLQACGPGWKDHKLIVVESYAKRMFVNPGTPVTKIIR